MIVRLLAIASLFAPSNQPQGSQIAIIEYLNQPERTICQRLFPKAIPSGAYVALMYLGKGVPEKSAVAIALPADKLGIQHLTIAYPYSADCPFVSELVDTNGKYLF